MQVGQAGGIMKIGRETFGGNIGVYTIGYVRHVKIHHIVYF